MLLFVNIEGAQKLFVQYLDHKTNVSRIAVPIMEIFPARSNMTPIDEIQTWISDRPEGDLYLSCDELISPLYTSSLRKVATKRYFTFFTDEYVSFVYFRFFIPECGHERSTERHNSLSISLFEFTHVRLV